MLTTRLLTVSAAIALAVPPHSIVAADPPDSASSTRISAEGAKPTWWSLRTPERPPVPHDTINNTAQPVDSFIVASLRSRGLEPAPRADRSVLIRRLCYVLTGLPPTPEQLDAFLRDDRPDAYESLVERTLNSPHFGERWARHWMDVVRYGDTYGYEWDIPAKGAWRYRDYLVRAFNQDVPFDQLVREHIAGDLLDAPRVNHRDQINESLIGPMFFQLGEKRHGDSAEFDGIHQEMLENKIDAFSKAFQATTIGCARCHDHKLDPVLQREYYALAGVFMSSRWVTNTLDTPERHRQIRVELASTKRQLREELARAWQRDSQAYAGTLLAAHDAPPGNSAGAADEQNSPALVAAWSKLFSEFAAKPPAIEHPLYAWAQLANADKTGDCLECVWNQVATEYESARHARVAANAENFKTVADFRDGVPDGWSIDGVGLASRPVARGEPIVALDGPALLHGLSLGGLVTNQLSPRANGAMRTPYLNRFDASFISFELAGGDFAAHRTVVDNAFLTERQVYLNQSRPAWVQLSTFPQMRERRIYIELATKTSNPNFPPRVGLGGKCTEEQASDPKSWFAVSRVLLHDKPGAPADELGRFASLFDAPAPQDLEQAADRIARWLGAAVDAWARNETTDDDVRLLNWMLDAGLLDNRRDRPTAPAIAKICDAYRTAEARFADPQTVNGMADVDPGYDYRLNLRGEYAQLGEPVPRGYVDALCKHATELDSLGSGRKQLAELVASPENPVTARVFVNRVWQWVFGSGLVETPDDFGTLGAPPSHPELLDYLATWFVDHGWSTKSLARMLVLSDTFRQSNDTTPAGRELDPRNRLLHHYPVQRLDAESIRDAILHASGRLEPRLYGPPVDPARAKEDPEKRLFGGPVDGLGRRSIYTKVTIMEPPRFLSTFNQPNPKIPSGTRDVTNVPAQTLALLNDPFVTEQAEHWARSLVAAGGESTIERLRRMLGTSLSREPSQVELERWQATVAELTRLHGVPDASIDGSVVVWKDVAHAIFNLKEFLYVR